MNRDKIVILSYGDTQAQALARRVRGGQVYCEILPSTAPVEAVRALNPRGLILIGKPADDRPEEENDCAPALYAMGIPVLAIGHGARCMARQLGGLVRHTVLENQTMQLHFVSSCPLFEGLSYSDRYINRLDMVDLPIGFSVIAHGHGMAAAFANESRRLYGMQFGIESNDPDGLRILSHFTVDICGCTPWWTTENFIETVVADIRAKIGGGQALMALSGGVDSSVSAALMHRAIGSQMHCFYIDTGLMRRGDTQAVRELLGSRMGIDIHCINARDRFLARLEGLTDPAQKWEAISSEFAIIYQEEAARLSGVTHLVKGTIYPDILNFSRDEQSLNELSGYSLIEPVRTLFKSEVRDVAEHLGLAPEITYRQSLPGSGLALRMTGCVTSEKLRLLREADYLFRCEVEQASLSRLPSRYCCHLIETTSTGDHHCHYIITLRALSQSGTVYSSYRLPYDLLERVTGTILAELPEIDRVTYELTPTPPRPVEWE